MQVKLLKDLKQADQNTYGREISDLLRVFSFGIDVEETYVISNELFSTYKSHNKNNKEQIESVSRTIVTYFKDYHQIDVYTSLMENNFGISRFEEVRLDLPILFNKLIEIYESWFDDRARAHRITYSIPDENTYPAIYIQPSRNAIHSLVTRCPISGQITNQDNIDNVGNSIKNLKREHELLIDELENCMKCPIQFTFILENGNLKLKNLAPESMTTNAKWNSMTDLYLKNIINKEEYVNLLEPEMIIKNTGIKMANTTNEHVVFYGLSASPGAAIGRLVFNYSDSNKFDDNPIFCCNEASPDDLSKIKKSVAAFSSRGGMTSHLALMLRADGKPGVVGASFYFDHKKGALVYKNQVFPELSYVMVNGNNGQVIASHKPIILEINYKASSSYENLQTAYSIIKSFSDSDKFGELSLEFQLRIATLLSAFNKIKFNQ
jgi:hypothetical protein